MTWTQNITGIEKGIYRTINGNADELIAIGRIIKVGFNCSRVDITNSRYDAIIDVGNGKLLRLQIKGFGTKSVSLTGGGRSGAQIDKSAPSRVYKYNENDCDFIIAVNSENGDCYIIPIEDTKAWGKTIAISKLSKYKENWDLLLANI